MKPLQLLLFFLLLTAISCRTISQKSQAEKITENAVNPDSIDMKIGQMILMGIDDRKFLDDFDPLKEEIKSGKVGGIVLFEKNFTKLKAADSLKLLIKKLQQQSSIPLFISIDEEGGKVHRMKEKYGFIKMPSASWLGKINNPDSTIFYNKKLSSMLSYEGINLNYAPDVDLALNPENQVIVKNERSFSKNPQDVTTQALACISAHHANNVKTIIKHFPGHGSSLGDSHTGFTDVTDTWQQTELTPFKNLIRSGNADGVMVAHLINRNWDSTGVPATLSYKVVTKMLRDSLGFEGVIFSDDMQMQAITKGYGQKDAIRKAILAGVDVLMFANNTIGQNTKISASEIHTMIKEMVDAKEIPASRINQSYQRILQFKNKSFTN